MTMRESLQQLAEPFDCHTGPAIVDLLATPGDDFKTAAERVLRKNGELYRRLA